MAHVNEKSFLHVKHLAWIDVAKGIGIILVMFAHVNYTPAILDTIYSFHMPLFFLISGILYNKHKYSSFKIFIRRKLQTLICPYILFYLFSLTYIYFIESLASGFSAFNFSAFCRDFLQMFISQGSKKVVSAPLWFVPCLFAVEIIYYFVSKIDKSFPILLISVFFAFTGWIFETYIVHQYNIFLFWSIDSAMFAFGFFTIGNLFSSRLNQGLKWIESHKHSFLIGLPIAVIGLAITAILAIPNGHVSLGSKILNNGFIFYVTGITGSLSIFVISFLLRHNRFFSYFGRNSFYVMAIHHPIRSTYARFTELTGFLTYDRTNLLQTLLPFIVVFTLTVLALWLYNKVKFYICKTAHSSKKLPNTPT